MPKTISVTKACENLAQIMSEVAGCGDDYIIERSGRPLVVIIPIEKYRRMSSEKEMFYEEIKIFQNSAADVSENELDDIIKEAVSSAKETERRLI